MLIIYTRFTRQFLLYHGFIVFHTFFYIVFSKSVNTIIIYLTEFSVEALAKTNAKRVTIQGSVMLDGVQAPPNKSQYRLFGYE